MAEDRVHTGADRQFWQESNSKQAMAKFGYTPGLTDNSSREVTANKQWPAKFGLHSRVDRQFRQGSHSKKSLAKFGYTPGLIDNSSRELGNITIVVTFHRDDIDKHYYISHGFTLMTLTNIVLAHRMTHPAKQHNSAYAMNCCVLGVDTNRSEYLECCGCLIWNRLQCSTLTQRMLETRLKIHFLCWFWKVITTCHDTSWYNMSRAPTGERACVFVHAWLLSFWSVSILSLRCPASQLTCSLNLSPSSQKTVAITGFISEIHRCSTCWSKRKAGQEADIPVRVAHQVGVGLSVAAPLQIHTN
ncbi:hypothetical protein RRG08_029813 [Elysia crispata]|uniref:Uncharacterized protein n=1 Tax=Elysia crispata TaxID=231223 RepID=A0AAE0YMG6_9GAST|nr:hypothetical protein RRG08_029813 [Elysia crispata]